MPNPVISTCTTTKNIAKNPLSQRCSPKNVANVTAFDISRSKKTKKKTRPWSFEPPPHRCWCRLYHLIAGNTAKKGKIHVVEIWWNCQKFVGICWKICDIEIHWDIFRYVEVYWDIWRCIEIIWLIDPSIFLETTSSHLDVDCYFVAWMQKMKPRVALRRYPAVVEAINQLTNQTNNQPTNHGSPKYHNISGEQMYKYMEI